MLEWNGGFSVNHPMMDADHQKMFEMINILYQSMMAGQDMYILEPLIDDLKLYTVSHFSREEKLLQSSKNPDFELQRREHAVFLDKLTLFKHYFRMGHTQAALEMLPVLNEWFSNHIMRFDMKYKSDEVHQSYQGYQYMFR